MIVVTGVNWLKQLVNGSNVYMAPNMTLLYDCIWICQCIKDLVEGVLIVTKRNEL